MTVSSGIGLEYDFLKELVGIGGIRVTLNRKSGTNQYGEYTYNTTPLTMPAMVVRMTKQIRTKDNQVKVSTAQVYLPMDYVIDPDDEIIMPDGTRPKILHIGAWTDNRGPYMQCVYT